MIRYQYKDASLLFVGINPHPGSFERAVPFSNNKLFWYLLARAGLIQEEIDDLRNDLKLKKIYKDKFTKVYGLGLVNIIDRPTRDITFLKKGEEDTGRIKIKRIVKSHKPKIVCFIGKITYQKFTSSKIVDFGWQEDFAHSKVYVMHAPLRGKAEVRIEEFKLVSAAARAAAHSPTAHSTTARSTAASSPDALSADTNL